MQSARSHKSAVSSNWGISSINDDSKINSDAGGSNPDLSDLDDREEQKNFPVEVDPLFADRFKQEK